jgi:hypothetical protein
VSCLRPHRQSIQSPLVQRIRGLNGLMSWHFRSVAKTLEREKYFQIKSFLKGEHKILKFKAYVHLLERKQIMVLIY